MKKYTSILLSMMLSLHVFAQENLQHYPVYEGTDLGLTVRDNYVAFKIWCPPAEQVQLLLFENDLDGEAYQTINLKKDSKGTWATKVHTNIENKYYTFRVLMNNTWSKDVADPYCKAVGTNGKRAQVVNLQQTNPPHWEKDTRPPFLSPTDAIIYELHVRDMTIHPSSGAIAKGLFNGLAEENTQSDKGIVTGIAHLKALGITHVHLLPVFDFNSVDERKNNQYNWGYDPLHYNVPEGSYSSNPSDGATRIKEFKALVMAFHRNGIRVIMDVVYNHTSQAQQSLFNVLVPDYYFRHKANGQFSDGAACGNETASEMPMMQKFMIESLVYWTNEYHIDGFRFDLMGLHDIATMNKISDTLHHINPTVLLYGEGWTASETPLPEKDRALKKHANQLHNIAVFGDDLRDGIKGSVFDFNDKGFASGKTLNTSSVKFGIVAAGYHPQIDYSKVNYSKAPYTNTPAQTISYCECHDNHTLYDKLKIACPTATETERIRMQELALTIVLTAQGIPFLHAGTEMLRNKKGIENSYNAGDSINAIDWNLKAQHAATLQYIIQLIQLRKLHPAFKMKSAQDIAKHLKFLENVPDGIIAFTLNGAAVGDSWKNILVVFNGSGSQQYFDLPELPWKFVLGNDPDKVQQITHTNRLYIGSYSAAIFNAE